MNYVGRPGPSLSRRSIQPQAVPLGAALLRLGGPWTRRWSSPAALATTEAKSTLLRIGLGVTRHPRMDAVEEPWVYLGEPL
jgi:hypothetical protein